MKAIPVEQAVGTVLCHDITQIVPGKFKGRAFKRGHIISNTDVPKLLSLGKEHIYVFDLNDGFVHEDDAAKRMAKAAKGEHLSLSSVCEGRINLHAEIDGLLKINTDALFEINSEEEIVFATIHGNQAVTVGRQVAGTRVVPLAVVNEKVERVENICANYGPIVTIKPFRPLQVGVVTTGSEVYHGRIKDAFGPILKKKFEKMGCSILRQAFVPDDTSMAIDAVRSLLEEGADMIALTGGMSVDPDDQTPSAIRALGADVVTYGAPTFPGAMFMLAYLGDIPVMGLPGCVMYSKASIFDLVAPRLVAGETVTRRDIIGLGHGGLCAGCETCRYPICGFGK
ncbi:molybdopterin-binding protein [Desulfovibrio inopinatus]|uniref:molybdopterin-binding protein n=1 Tax=Desulfovibrio inopinatus TaxID=102109 RepID=UPI000417AD4B|nr:molybdopterin-binding protein [Desulfovibrio inopinatus]